MFTNSNTSKVGLLPTVISSGNIPDNDTIRSPNFSLDYEGNSLQ